MIEQLYKRINKEEFPHIYKIGLENNLFFFYSKINCEGKDYFAILGFDIPTYNSFSVKTIKSIVYFLNKYKKIDKIPSHLENSNKVIFLDRKKRPILDIEASEKVYSIIWAKEMLYTKEFIKISKVEVESLKKFYEFSQTVKIYYPEAEDPEDEELYKISKELTKSDLQVAKLNYELYKKALDCQSISHEISHKPKSQNIELLKRELNILEKKLNLYKTCLEKRLILWAVYEPLLERRIRRKLNSKKGIKYLIAVILDILNLPLNTLTLLVKDAGKVIYDSFIGYKAIEKTLKKTKKDINFFDKYISLLFNPSIPSQKLKDSIDFLNKQN